MTMPKIRMSRNQPVRRRNLSEIDEVSEEESSDSSSPTVSDLSKRRGSRFTLCEINLNENVPPTRVKEAEDIAPKDGSLDDISEIDELKRERAQSVSDSTRKPFRSILRGTPHRSKEDVNFHEHNKILFSDKADEIIEEKEVPRGVFTQKSWNSKDLCEQGNQEEIDKYYERNQYTITDKHQDTVRFRQLSEHLRTQRDETGNGAKRSIATYSIIPPHNAFQKSFYWLAHHHQSIGLRHMCMLLLVLCYTMLGAVLFYTIESRHEKEIMGIHKVNLEKTMFEIAQRLEIEILDPNKLTNISQMEEFLKTAYVRMLQTEDLYAGSTFYKHENPDKNLKWTIGSAFFFSMNLYTTTGYGSIAPSSTLGKACVIVYGLLFVPLTLVVLRDLGQFALVFLTKTYVLIQNSWRRQNGMCDKGDEDEYVSLPVKLAIAINATYLIIATTFIFEYDALSGPPDSGITFFHAFYFCFVSISTIGLGDIMPNNVTFSPIITILFFFGMPIMKVVNKITYVRLENGVFGTMTVLENRLDRAWNSAHRADLPVEIEAAQSRKTSIAPSNKKSVVSICTNASCRCADHEIQAEAQNANNVPNEYLNNFTIRSIATFMRNNGDVYGGGFGRVNVRRGDLMTPTSNVQNDNQNTVRGLAQMMRRGGDPTIASPGEVNNLTVRGLAQLFRRAENNGGSATQSNQNTLRGVPQYLRRTSVDQSTPARFQQNK